MSVENGVGVWDLVAIVTEYLYVMFVVFSDILKMVNDPVPPGLKQVKQVFVCAR